MTDITTSEASRRAHGTARTARLADDSAASPIPVVIKIGGIKQFISVAVPLGDGSRQRFASSSPRSAAGPLIVRGDKPQAWSPWGRVPLSFRAPLELGKQAARGFSECFQRKRSLCVSAVHVETETTDRNAACAKRQSSWGN